ncbi:hypothetical protein BT63DRAFT_425924 [Microthyrium microscopicum]|uniref:Zn(2)-C6 fungal-type domain-containing protein n=1 Tax=Microthyrium microscopicum TaxID=703497 RepID=A0A6A6UBD1_9PEZI|nr:hypothetical protein BT63DRAFT_425924 [Microthyrium microscopicum]
MASNSEASEIDAKISRASTSTSTHGTPASNSPDTAGEQTATPSKRRQKRNKPTLSCSECVERKTKCDRLRPACVACVKRQSVCRYSDIANLIAANGNGRAGIKSKKHAAKSAADAVNNSPGLPTPNSFGRSTSISSQSSPFLLSNVPHTSQPPYHVFGTGSQHPFANYWTTQGGIPEVVGVLPTKEQADTLIAKYFEAVDPVYPLLHKESTYAEYDQFWALPQEQKCFADASLLALHFAMYAMGAQFLQMESDQARQQISEFYVSAAHQSLRLYPFLSRTSLHSIQAMILMAYFLMNDNKATDAWAFTGILVKQAYAMGLHRDPDIIAPKATEMEKNQRRKVWYSTFHQDVFLTVLVKLPPTTTFSDVSIDSLTEDGIEPEKEASIITNPMSISAIAPRQMTPPIPPPPHTSVTAKSDVAFIRSMWRLAELVQRTICQPRALSQPLTTSTRQKTQLLSNFHSLYSSFPSPLSDSRSQFFANLVATNPRIARQSIFLRSNYWHCIMIIQADANEAAGVKCDVRGAIEAARLAIRAYFDFWDGLRPDAGVWFVSSHRCFEEALTISNLLAALHPSHSIAAVNSSALVDPFFIEARDDVRRVLEILEQVGTGAPEMQKTRTEVLRAAYEAIAW